MPSTVSVIVATLLRPSLSRLLASLRQQTLPKERWELITWQGEVNEYAARNRAVKAAKGDLLCFLDDDVYVPSDYLEKGCRHFSLREGLMVLDCALEGNLWGYGWMRLDREMWFVGTTLWTRRSAFEELGGFEDTWGLNPPPRGWRGDTDYGLRAVARYGKEAYLHAGDMVVYHPEPMKSVWDPRVEERFYLRHREFCLREVCPVDPRLCQFVLKNGIERDPDTVKYLEGLLREFEKRYGIKLP